MSSPTMSNLRTPSKISFHPNSESPSASHHLIFFITGNPGLVSYYTTFLSTLGSLLSSSSTRNTSDVFHIYSQSLAGFEDESVLTPPSRMTPYSLEEQIIITLEAVTAQHIPSGPLKNQHYATITLIGHSVGAYILLELIARIRKSSSPLNIRGGVLLFPTVTHLAQSPSGVKVTPILNNIPDLPRKINLVAKCLVWIIPRSVLKWIVGKVASMPDDAAEVTIRFLRSPMGVWQALHLAKDEFDTITEDKWDEDIWGVEHEDLDHKFQVPKLIFYFGEKDHWVAGHTRDALIAARAKGERDTASSKPIMLIDENGINHAFSIRHSERIAEKVKMWVEEIVTSS